LKENGIQISKDQKKELIKNLSSFKNFDLKLFITKEQIRSSNCASYSELSNLINIAVKKVLNLSDSKTQKLLNDIQERTAKSIIKTAIDNIHKRYKNSWKEQLLTKQKLDYDYNQRLKRAWEEPIDKMEAFINFVVSSFSFIDKDLSHPNQEDSDKINVLTRLLARSIIIAKEVLVLIKSGFSDGAYARCRAIYESTVIAIFIEQRPEIYATKYIEHLAIQDFKIELERRGESPYNDPEHEKYFQQVQEERNRLIEIYGPKFKMDYGWAYNSDDLAQPVFSEIERIVSLSHFRLNYRSASTFIHSNSGSLFNQVSIPPNADYYLTGASSFGLEVPGTWTTFILWQMFTVYLTCEEPILDRLAISEVIYIIRKDVIESFYKVADSMKINKK